MDKLNREHITVIGLEEIEMNKTFIKAILQVLLDEENISRGVAQKVYEKEYTYEKGSILCDGQITTASEHI